MYVSVCVCVCVCVYPSEAVCAQPAVCVFIVFLLVYLCVDLDWCVCVCVCVYTQVSLPVCRPGPEARRGGALAPPRCRSWGCSRSHSRCSARFLTTRKTRRRTTKTTRSAFPACPCCRGPRAWRPAPRPPLPGPHPASWRSGTQTRPECKHIHSSIHI